MDDDWLDDDPWDLRTGFRGFTPAVGLGAALSFHRRVSSSLADEGLTIVVRILPNLKVRVETQDGRPLMRGAWLSTRVDWERQPVPEIPRCALDMVAEDINGVLELFKTGRLDATKWTSNRRALRALRPPPRGTIRIVATPE